MIKVIKTIGKVILPSGMQAEIRKKMSEKKHREQEKRALDAYNDISKIFPGFVALGPYSKSDKVFEGVQYYSQFYQDYFLDKYVFRGKKSGFFLDVGGNDPININNTYFFEKERNWTGLAFEPMPAMNAKWKDCRVVECVQAAVGSTEGKIEFKEYEDNYMSGISDTVDYDGKVKNAYQVDVVTIGKELQKRNIRHVDFMSMDIEGAELDALKGIDFKDTIIDYIVVENNKGKEYESEMRQWFIEHGYTMIARLWIDDVWKKTN
ncbi:FkbM family methyltransferase [Butyrivibrio proteoclasticus]|uniref:FkbM family methyltransferase n=1 Tax=Butyrivibrio proteoclasticus TaxID=43305 RepID=UPI00047A66B5|nr:FkbM family methyltransferase [Butyrivibrio proteoclasticus]